MSSLVDELEELDLVGGEVGGVDEDLPKDVDILALDRHGMVAVEDHELKEAEQLALGFVV